MRLSSAGAAADMDPETRRTGRPARGDSCARGLSAAVAAAADCGRLLATGFVFPAPCAPATAQTPTASTVITMHRGSACLDPRCGIVASLQLLSCAGFMPSAKSMDALDLIDLEFPSNSN